jgi:hypothetical protein
MSNTIKPGEVWARETKIPVQGALPGPNEYRDVYVSSDGVTVDTSIGPFTVGVEVLYNEETEERFLVVGVYPSNDLEQVNPFAILRYPLPPKP